MSYPFILYCHIEKCAGTTLNYLLANNFPYMIYPSSVRYTNDPTKAFSEMHLKKLLKIFPLTQGISGHNIRPFINYENALKSESFFFTFFREPISRYMSDLNYQRIKMNIDWKIDDFIGYERMNDFQTIKIAGTNDLDFAVEIATTRFDFYGITEFFDQSIYLLSRCSSFRLKPQYYLRNATISSKKEGEIKPILWEHLSKNQKQKILENNRNDIALYDYLVKEFQDRYNKVTKGKFSDSGQFNYKIKSKSPTFYYSMAVKKIYRHVIEPGTFRNYLALGVKRK